MVRLRSSVTHVLVLAAAALAIGAPALAQTDCITPNCAFAGTPARCLNKATPRTPTVLLGSGLQNIYIPSNPKIEPGECILWRAQTSTHSSSGVSCTEDVLCGSPAPPECEWDTANIDSFVAPPTSTCYYDPALFPAAAASNFYCRIHATPTVGTMRGTLQVTTPIVMTVDKDLGTNSIKLAWTGGGVTGDLSYKVVRQAGGNPTFPVGATTTTVNPDGGVLGTAYTDVGVLASSTSRYYLVRNKQTNEP